MDGVHDRAALGRLRELLGELNDLKRVRASGVAGSMAEILFDRSWTALAAGDSPGEVALATTAAALASTKLGAIDAPMLERCGLDHDRLLAVLERSLDAVAGPLDVGLRMVLRDRLGYRWRNGVAPPFVAALADQPRAGATSPGAARIVLEPPESHADHCLMVAVYGVIVAPLYDAEPADAFLLGLVHHLHNAVLPDSGFAGEELLGDDLAPIMERLTVDGLATLPPSLVVSIEPLRPLLAGVDHPVSRAFHTADVIDRVIQARQYARVAAFTIDHALRDLELVHAGPIQAFHLAVLAEAGLP